MPPRRSLVRPGECGVEVGDRAVGDPGLRPLERVPVVGDLGARGHPDDVRAGLRFRQRVRTELVSGDQRRQQRFLLLRRSELVEWAQRHHVDRDPDADAHPHRWQSPPVPGDRPRTVDRIRQAARGRAGRALLRDPKWRRRPGESAQPSHPQRPAERALPPRSRARASPAPHLQRWAAGDRRASALSFNSPGRCATALRSARFHAATAVDHERVRN